MALRLLILLLVIPGAVAASDFSFTPRPLTRSLFAQAEPQQDIKPTWGLWADRAPYPYYDGPFGIDVADDLIARDIWFDFSADIWLTPNGYRGASGMMRARFGLFFADVSYTQLASVRDDGWFTTTTVKDSSYITDARGHLGLTVPLPVLGYLDFGVGLSGFDETPGLSRLGASFRASASIFPIWPLELEAGASRAQFFDGTGVNEFNVKAHVQMFRHLFITAGWRWMNIDGNSFTTHGFMFGISFQWGNLRTFFWDPMRGPAW